MENTLLTGDFLLVNKFVYGVATPRVIPLWSCFGLPGQGTAAAGTEFPTMSNVAWLYFMLGDNRDNMVVNSMGENREAGTMILHPASWIQPNTL